MLLAFGFCLVLLGDLTAGWISSWGSQSLCCERGFTHVNLRKSSMSGSINIASGIQFIQNPTAQSGVSEDCSKTALLKINFEKFSKGSSDGICLNKPKCGRRMLRIDMKLSSGTRSGRAFNIGDSDTNNGYRGDSNTQMNDAEADGKFPNVVIYPSDKCPKMSQIKSFSNIIGPGVNDVSIYVSDQHIRIVNDKGVDDNACDGCLFALNGQADPQGINEDVYLGLNRVITGRSDRNGVGVCSATLSWVCPDW